MPKLNEDMIHRITNLLRAGNTVEGAAAAAGIARMSYYNWHARGTAEIEEGFLDNDGNPTTIHGQFVRAVERAIAQSPMRPDSPTLRDKPLSKVKQCPGLGHHSKCQRWHYSHPR